MTGGAVAARPMEEYPIFWVAAVWSVLPKLCKDEGDLQGIAGRGVEGCERPENLLGDSGLMKALKIILLERLVGGGPEGASKP